MLLGMMDNVNIGSEETFLSNLLDENKMEGKKKENDEDQRNQLVHRTMNMKHLETQRIRAGRWEGEQWKMELMCMCQKLWASTGNLFHEY